MALTFTSSVFEHGGSIPSQYTCDGKNINPPFSISGVPEEAVSLVLVMEDPDVPEGAGVDVWDHWVVWNIPAHTSEILEGEEPAGVHGIGTSDNRDYYGPCPPDGEHRYFFRLYALDSELSLDEGATKEDLHAAMDGHVIAQAELMGRYDRS